MKDFYDLWVLGQQFPYDGAVLHQSIATTFKRRSIAVPERIPVGLSAAFAEDIKKQSQWKVFVKQSGAATTQGLGLVELISFLAEFLWPLLQEANIDSIVESAWSPGGPWRKLAISGKTIYE